MCVSESALTIIYVCFSISIDNYLVSYSTNMSNFQPLEVVGRGSETQLQVAENLNKI